jgi:hypothetical protein
MRHTSLGNLLAASRLAVNCAVRSAAARFAGSAPPDRLVANRIDGTSMRF